MKTILIILFFVSSTLCAQYATRITKTDSDSLWQELKEFDRDIKDEFTLHYYEKDNLIVYSGIAFPADNLPKALKRKIFKRIKRI